MLRVLLALVASAVLSACGLNAEDDERTLVPDAEISAVQQELVPPVAAPDPASSGRSFYVRLAWGHLSGDRSARDWVDWSGSLSVSEGAVSLTHLTYFDREDRPNTQLSPDRISWSSRTRPHFDGIVARVELPSDDATVTLDLPRFHRTFRATELTGGDEASFPVDAEGDAVSISSIPASSCPGGFVLGYLRTARDGRFTAFGGRVTDRTGRFVGTIRFRALEDGTLLGRVTDAGRELATVRGTLVNEGGGGSFSAELVDENGRAVGSLTGLYTGASHAQRGSFQGSFEQPCSR